MQKPMTIVFAIVLGICVFFVLVESAEADDTDGQCTSMRMKPESKNSYSYIPSSSIGPSRWGDVNSICETGNRQSPINVITTPVQPRNTTESGPHIPVLDLPYKVVLKYNSVENNFKLKCAGDIVPTCGSISIGGLNYSLIQSHWHSPSEHYINGQRYPLEVHNVFASPDGKLAVVGTMFTIGKSDAMLAAVIDAAKRKDYAVVRLPGITDGSICTWQGSLTTPPCSEGVFWIMNLKVREASLQEIGEYRAMVGEKPNARPMQGSNGRNITCFK